MRPYRASNSYVVAGFTLTEIAIVLGIVGLLLAAVWTASAMVRESMRQSKFAKEIVQMHAVTSQYGRGIAVNNYVNDLLLVGGFPVDLGSTTPWQTTINSVPAGQAALVSFQMPTSSCISAYIRNCGDSSSLYCGMANLATAQTGLPPTPITTAMAAGQCVNVGNSQSLFQLIIVPSSP